MRGYMPGFLLAVGNGHYSLAQKMLAGGRCDAILELGVASLTKGAVGWTLVEWGCGYGQGEADLAVASDDVTGTACLLSGYLTQPQPVTRKTVQADPAPFLALIRAIASEPAGSTRLLSGLNGSFTLLTIASPDGTVRQYTDRFASRSVWRAHHEGAWLFASHPVLLWLALGKRYAVNPATLGSLLLRARPSGAGSLLSVGCRNLPGSLSLFRGDGRDEHTRWFRPQYRPESGLSTAQWGNRLAAGLRGASGRLAGATTKPLLFLSGGLDSRLALAALACEFKPSCVTLFDGENFETRTARSVAKAVGTPHHTVSRDRLWYLRVMERAALLQGGNYHPAHSHFSEGLKKLGGDLDYDSVLLGDFLEAFQKLLGGDARSPGPRPDPSALCDQVLNLDGHYSASQKMGVLQFVREPLRSRVFEAWRSDLMLAATEALQVSSEYPASVDYFLRWRAAYEVATYGMIEDVRSLAPERSLSMDNEIHDLMLSIPARQRMHGRIAIEALKRLCPELARIRNANTMLPAHAPYWCHKTVKLVRPRLGAARQAFNRRFGITNAVMASSWTDCRLLGATDPQWIGFFEAILCDPAAIPGSIFDAAQIREVWRRYRAGELPLGFSIDSLLTFGIIHKHFGSGELA